MEILVILLGGAVGFNLYRLKRLEDGYKAIHDAMEQRGLVKKRNK